jgi:hypothetical protein
MHTSVHYDSSYNRRTSLITVVWIFLHVVLTHVEATRSLNSFDPGIFENAVSANGNLATEQNLPSGCINRKKNYCGGYEEIQKKYIS